MEKPTFLFISSAFKGGKMLQRMHDLGVNVWLITEEKWKNEAWPHEALENIYYMPDLRRYTDIIHAVSYLARERKIERIIPLDEFEVELAAILREHLRLPGMRASETRIFRDKLAMREVTHAGGIPVPEFCSTVHFPALSEFLNRVQGPWMLKPRMEAGAMGITKCNSTQEIWDHLRGLGDKASFYLVEQYLPGNVYHVDSIVVDGKILYASAQKYGMPPMDVYHGGGVFTTIILDRESPDAVALYEMNKQLLSTMNYKNGITHAEFIKHGDDFYFLEVAARVGGSFISDLLEYATNINPWEQWSELIYAEWKGEKYKLPKVKKNYGGLIVCLSRQEYPDMSAYDDPEIVWKGPKAYHAALIAVSPKYAKIEELMNNYAPRFAEDFLAVGRPEGATRTGMSGV